MGFGVGFFCKITLDLIPRLYIFRSSSQAEELEKLKTRSKGLLENGKYSFVSRLESLGIPFKDMHKHPAAHPKAQSLCALMPVQTLRNFPLAMALVPLK